MSRAHMSAETDPTLQFAPGASYAAGNDVLLHTESLQKIYDGRVVVNGVDIEVKKGEIVGLLGPNGAGKTTTFYMIVGLVRPDGGKVVFEGKDATHEPMFKRARMGMGYLPQEESIFRRLTVRENTERPITIHEGTNTLVGTSPRELLRAAGDVLANGGKRGRVPDLWDGRAAERVAQARFAVYGDSVYPDATSSLRLSYGKVAGWTWRGAETGPYTTFAGLFARCRLLELFIAHGFFLAGKNPIEIESRLAFVFLDGTDGILQVLSGRCGTIRLFWLVHERYGSLEQIDRNACCRGQSKDKTNEHPQ